MISDPCVNTIATIKKTMKCWCIYRRKSEICTWV